jgi:hypothetical protein
MSLEETLAALVDAVNANTDALQHLAATYRQPPAPLSAMTQAITAPTPPAADAPKRGRPAKTPPPAPMDLASSPPAAGATASTPATAPAADAGSAQDSDPAPTYEDMKALFLETGEKKGKAEVTRILALLGLQSGLQMKEAAHVGKIPDAIRLFRASLEADV